jgi:sec-independent protein translocase protein TatC
MSLFDHLEDLRRRVFYALVGIVPILIAAIIFMKPMLAFLVRPLQKLLTNAGMPIALQSGSPMEGFNTAFKVAILATILVGSPWILFQLWRFVSPGLYAHERRYVYFLIPLSIVLSVTGVAINYYFILPLALRFLIAFSADIGLDTFTLPPVEIHDVLPVVPVLQGDPKELVPNSMWIVEPLHELRIAMGTPDHVTVWKTALTKEAGVLPQFRIGEYVGFVLTLMGAFALAFQLPVAVLLLGWINILRPETLRKFRKYALVLSVILGAMVTPGDPLTRVLAAIPLYALYELSIFLLVHFPASKVGNRKAGDPSRF